MVDTNNPRKNFVYTYIVKKCFEKHLENQKNMFFYETEKCYLNGSSTEYTYLGEQSVT